MTDFEVAFTDKGSFAQKMQAAPGIVREELIASTNKLTTQGSGWAKEKLTANGSVVTGHLRRSVASKPATAGGGGVSGSFGTATTYAHWVEEGRKAFAMGAKVLRFKAKGSGKMVFARSVKAAKAKPFMKPTGLRVRQAAVIEYRAAMKRIASRMGLG